MNIRRTLEQYAVIGVDALSRMTPVKTGLTARSWEYQIHVTPWGYSITWWNTNENQGANIAILLQYGHGTRTGGYVQGRDYINPAIQPVFDQMTEEIWKEVRRL